MTLSTLQVDVLKKASELQQDNEEQIHPSKCLGKPPRLVVDTVTLASGPVAQQAINGLVAQGFIRQAAPDRFVLTERVPGLGWGGEDGE